ncbi:MAG: AbrB/MazE/SpoVT family DNA-binding domain-containing protein [Verrucomicrobia bacterium]|nr:AbrB/MazE/SpoVT family DNA-binding domain-containing protein [Verrucomicrobiota bacterium]MDA1065981.1 AbrB/MazE/SpoVT family DNA-binding domain-containing protein [Verrucomicrobiota bacterium]
MRTKVSSKGQVVIPKSVRNHYQWKPGTVLNIEETDHGVVLSPVTDSCISQDEVFGCLKGKVSRRVTLKEMDAIIEELAQRSRA